MDRISNLSDDLLLEIFSSLPTKDVAATMLLSKRWRFVWNMIPKLDFDDGFELEPSRFRRFREYVDRSLALNRAPVLEALKLDVGLWCSSEDIATWIRIGMARHVRELEVVRCKEYDHESDNESESDQECATIRLPKTLYTYEKLEVLKLANRITLDVPIDVCFPSLKTLHLISVEYETKECHVRLLSGCPVLEELVLDKTSTKGYPLRSFYVDMPNLRRLSVLDKCPIVIEDGIHRIVINVPSLKYLNFVDFFGNSCLCENMPDVVEANVMTVYGSFEKLLRSLPSVQRLNLCAVSMDQQQHVAFCHLVHLELCTYSLWWWDLLTWMLQSSPKLQVLKLCQCNERHRTPMAIMDHWRGPSEVPECLMLHLHTFKWKNYKIKYQEKKMVAYILRNARQLKIACSYYRNPKKEKSKKELASLPRASSSCQLLLD